VPGGHFLLVWLDPPGTFAAGAIAHLRRTLHARRNPGPALVRPGEAPTTPSRLVRADEFDDYLTRAAAAGTSAASAAAFQAAS
jgi:hypothetical protein